MVNSRIVLITGVSKGLGSWLSRIFAKKGDMVFGIYHESSILSQKLANEIISQNGKCNFYKADLKQCHEIEKVVKAIRDQYGRIDVLINNAAITRDNLIVKMSEMEWDEVLDTNLKGAFLMMRECIPLMQKEDRTKHIINISSINGRTGNNGQANYAASKAGLIALTKVAAMELKEFKISVNAVIPGFLQTAMTKKLNNPSYAEKRSVEDIANGIYFLTQFESITGQTLSLEDRITKDDTIRPLYPSCNHWDRVKNCNR